jgi:hypothetical protein
MVGVRDKGEAVIEDVSPAPPLATEDAIHCGLHRHSHPLADEVR